MSTTKLDAVNTMLDAIGEAPVSSLGSGLPDAAAAEMTLDRVSREVQAIGWHVNTETDYALAVDVDNHIRVPQNALRVDPCDRSNDLVVRRLDGVLVLYDKKKHSFEFDKAVKVDIVWLYDFEDLTPELQSFITMRAAVEFQQSEMTSMAADRMLKDRMIQAWASALDAEAEAADYNVLTQSPYASWSTYRNNILWGR